MTRTKQNDDQKENQHIPREILRLSACTGSICHTLELSFMGLVSLPDCLFNKTSLRVLKLDGNRITRLPTAIARLRHLTQLDLNGNCLERLTPSLAALTLLQRLDVRGNRLATLPTALQPLVEKRRLLCGGNPWLADAELGRLLESDDYAAAAELLALRRDAEKALEAQQCKDRELQDRAALVERKLQRLGRDQRKRAFGRTLHAERRSALAASRHLHADDDGGVW